MLGPEERNRLASNIAGHLKAATAAVRERAVANFSQVHPDFGALIKSKLG